MTAGSVTDRRERPLGVLRLSLTARCNLACPYCCPDVNEPAGLLSLDAQLAVVRAACALGAHVLRLTGGEPFLSDRLWPLLEAIALDRGDGSGAFQALQQIALTTNGVLLSAQRAQRLRQLGVNRLTISLDAVQPACVARMAGLQGGAAAGERLFDQVMRGIEAARQAGFDPARGELKLNSVIQKGVNDDQLIPLATLARQQGLELRLIEYMDVGNRNGWTADQVLSAAEMVALLQSFWPLEPQGRGRHATAQRWRYRDGGGVVGVIASITEPFCGDCNRLRVTADGQAFTCLFAAEGVDLKTWLTPVLDQPALTDALRGLWQRRDDRFSELRTQLGADAAHAEMAYLGG